MVGVILAVAIGGIASHSVTSTFKEASSMEEVNETIWKVPGFWFLLWAYGVPFAAILAGTGIIFYGHGDKSVLFGGGTLLVVAFISIINMPLPHIPILFGIGGNLILLFFFGILWLYSRKLNERGSYFKLTGYTFLLTGLWFSCEKMARPYLTAAEGLGESPANIMIFFVLAFLFFFLGEREKQ
ncbi:hypothetical protein MCMEM_1024 [Methanococcoides methylutens MM1]|uniref:Uncharacterized protein n=1 Tax=Methanococcoides methylutens MM1 TaxID=1434104 RepID=A0A0E3SRZ8_METMT|nr:hypothetical protein MCMEM_1024 [Methanococcoides methylutens MM1]